MALFGKRYTPAASLPAFWLWAPPAERGPWLESIYRVSLTVDLCEGNKIISLKHLFYHSQLGAPQKEKKSVALGTCPVCPLVKTALVYTVPLPPYGPQSNFPKCMTAKWITRLNGYHLPGPV